MKLNVTVTRRSVGRWREAGRPEGGREVAWDVRADGRGAPSGRERADVLALAPLGWVVALVGQQHDPVVQL